MSVTRKPESDLYQYSTGVAREVRGLVGEQMRELLVEGDRMGSRSEVAEKIEQLVFVGRRVAEARGRQLQARELGMPVSVHVEAEREALELLRASAMAVGVACGAWVAALDYAVRARSDNAMNGLISPNAVARGEDV